MIMEIKLNDKPTCVTAGSTLGAVLAGRGINAHGIAASVNGHVIAPELWSSTVLSEGDSIVLLKAFFGG